MNKYHFISYQEIEDIADDFFNENDFEMQSECSENDETEEYIRELEDMELQTPISDLSNYRNEEANSTDDEISPLTAETDFESVTSDDHFEDNPESEPESEDQYFDLESISTWGRENLMSLDVFDSFEYQASNLIWFLLTIIPSVSFPCGGMLNLASLLLLIFILCECSVVKYIFIFLFLGIY